MSFLENADLQIWNNAAFDHGESKENRRLSMVKSPVCVKSTIPIKPLQPKNSIDCPKLESSKIAQKQDLGCNDEEEVRDEIKIDSEIEAIEKEINRLSIRLESLRLEKLEKNAKTAERKGKIVRAKFMDKKNTRNNLGVLKNIENPSPMISVNEMNRRGVSLGPSEIITGSGFRSRRLSSVTKPPPEITFTPVQSAQSRRKTCFWKLGGIDEGKVTKERGGKSSSVSPKSRKTGVKCTLPKQPFTTSVGSKKHVKKEDGLISSLIKPKKLFNGEKSSLAKKPMRIGRVVASRYSLTPQIQSNGNGGSSALRKRSLPEDDKGEDRRRSGKKRAASLKLQESSSSECGEFEGIVSRLKKKWEIPSETVVAVSGDPSSPITNNNDTSKHLPKIKTIRCVNETPRDSGAAKRVADLVNKKSIFCGGEYDEDDDESMQPSICQALSFADENV